MVENLKKVDPKNVYILIAPKDEKDFSTPQRWAWDQFRFPRQARQHKVDILHQPCFYAPLFYRGKIVITGYFDETEGRDKLLIFLAGADNEATRFLCREIKNHFSAVIGLSTETFVLIRSGDIPRTSSGKIQRYKLVERFRLGSFSNIICL